jgi:hypothetical protein
MRMKGYVFWDIDSRSPLEINRRFETIEGRKQSFPCYSFHFHFLFGLFPDPESGGDTFFPNVGWLSTELRGVTFQKREPLVLLGIIDFGRHCSCRFCSLVFRRRVLPPSSGLKSVEWTNETVLDTFSTEGHEPSRVLERGRWERRRRRN